MDNYGPRATVFPTKSKMQMQLYNDANEYWVKKERHEWLQNQRERFTRMSQEDWEHYIKTLELGKCESDFMELVNEFTTRFWFAKQRVFDTLSIQDLDKKIEDKFEQDCEAKELRYVGYYTLYDRNVHDRDVRDTLKALITELKIERQIILAVANKRYKAPGDLGVNCCPTAILFNDV